MGLPPRWLVWLAMAIVVAGSLMTCVGAVRIGVSADEGFHVIRLRNFLAHGWYLLDDDLAGGRPGAWVSDRWVYAPVTTLLLHGLNIVAGNESAGQVSASASSYAVRHLGVAAIGMVGVVATAATARRVMGSWQWGLVAAGTLLAIPMWSGHAMFNVKDTPVATGYMLVTLGCVMSWEASRGAHAARWFSAVATVSGLLLAVGTRPGLWPGPVSAIGLVGLVSLWRPGLTASGRQWWRCADLIGMVVVALAGLAAIYPNLFLRSIQWIAASSSESASAGGTTAGPGYIPLMVMCTVPAGLLLLGMAGLFSAALEARRSRSGSLSLSVPLLLVLLQTLFIPALLAVKAPPLTGLLRHVLFAGPTAAIMLTIGIAATLQLLSGRMSKVALGLSLAASMITPVVAQVELFPYSYSYVNEIVDASGIDFAPDYWRTSYRELLPVVPADEFVVCSPAVTADGIALRRMEPGGQSLLDLGEDCRTAPSSVIAPYVNAAKPLIGVSGSFISLQQVAPDEVPENCTEIGRVERRRHIAVQVVSIASRCTLVLPDYDGPISLDGIGTGAKYLLGGWTGNGGAPWIEAVGPAHLGFRLPSSTPARELQVEGAADGSVQFRLNNQPVNATPTASGWTLATAGVPALGALGNLVLTVLPDGAPVRVTRVEMVEVGQ